MLFERPISTLQRVGGEIWCRILELSREYALCIGAGFPPRTYLGICNEQINFKVSFESK